MAIAWMGGLQSVADLGALLALKRNGQAAEALRARLEGRAPTVEMRFRYADLLIRADRGPEAIPTLLGLADELLPDGPVERCIDALRTVLGIDPDADLRPRLGALSRRIRRGPRHGGAVHRAETEPLRASFGERRWSPRMRLRLAGLVHSAGDPEAAAAILLSLADDLVEAGLPVPALAIMEGIDRQHAARDSSFDSWLGALLREQWATDEPLSPTEP